MDEQTEAFQKRNKSNLPLELHNRLNNPLERFQWWFCHCGGDGFASLANDVAEDHCYIVSHGIYHILGHVNPTVAKPPQETP